MAICPICSSVSEGKRITYGGFDIFDLCTKCASYSICLINPNVEIPAKQSAIRWAETEIQNNSDKRYLANCIRSWKQCAEDYISANTPRAADIYNNETNLEETVSSFGGNGYPSSSYDNSLSSSDSAALDVRKTNLFNSAPAPEPRPAPFSAPVPFSAPFSASADYEDDTPYIPSRKNEIPVDMDSTQIYIPDAVEEKSSPAAEEISFEPAPDFSAATEEAYEESFIEEVAAAADAEGEIISNENNTLTEEELEAEAKAFYEEAEKNFTEDEPDIKDYLREIALTLKSMNEKVARLEKEISELKK